ncbi:MAG TPA: YcxB family protein [Tepidisphaeraceae bacterium]|nr:YcxB family protein [Tepidisphaeraceae bacterium]
MRIELNYTIAELKESIVPEAYAANPSQYDRRLANGLLSWVVVAAIIVIITWQSTTGSHQFPNRVDLISTMLPNLVAATCLAVAILLLLWGNWRKTRVHRSLPEKPARRATRARAIVAVFFGVAMTLPLIAAAVPDEDLSWHATRSELLLANFAPWVVNLLLYVMFVFFYSRWRARQQWLANPAWQRRQTLELDETGLRITDALTNSHHAWAYFRRAWETPNLLVIQSETEMLYLIPKRTFTNPSEIESARALLQNKIANTTFLVKPTGFPVAPKPVILIEHATDGSARDADRGQ